MKAVFILSDVDYFIDLAGLSKPYIFYASRSNFEQIKEKFDDFHSKIFGLEENLKDRYGLEDDIILVVLRDGIHQERREQINSLIEAALNDSSFNKINNCFIFECAGNPADIDWDMYKSSINKMVQNLPNQKDTFSIFFTRFLFNGATIQNMDNYYHQAENLIDILSKNLEEIRPTLHKNDKKNTYAHIFGSSRLIIPYDTLKAQGNHFSNASHLAYLLTPEVFKNWDEHFKELDQNKAEELLEHEDVLDGYIQDYLTFKPDGKDLLPEVTDKWLNHKQLKNLDSNFHTGDFEVFSRSFKKKHPDKIHQLIKHEKQIQRGDELTSERTSSDITSDFFNTLSSTFKQFKNNELIHLEDECADQKEQRKKSFQEYVNNLQKQVFDLKRETIVDRYDQTTHIDTCVALVDILKQGKSEHIQSAKSKNQIDYSISAIKEQKLIDKDSYALYDERQKILNNFNQKTQDAQDQLSHIDDELSASYERKRNYLSHLKLGVFDGAKPFYSLKKYSILSRIVFFVLLSILMLNGLFLRIGSITLFHHLIYGLAIPVFIGSLFLGDLLFKKRKLQKQINHFRSQKEAWFISILKQYDALNADFLECVKEEYMLNLLDELNDWLDLKKYYLLEFKKYLFRHFLHSITHYYQQDLEKDYFDISLISKDQLKDIIKDNISPFFDISGKEGERLKLWQAFLNKADAENDHPIYQIEFQRKIFEEIDPFEIIEPVAGHKTEADYNDVTAYYDNPVLFLNNNEQHQVSIEDIKQGNVGNCYYLAALGSIAEKHPDYISNMIYDNGNQTYTIRFFDNNSHETYTTVDQKFWFEKTSHTPLYARLAETSDNYAEIWPMIFEKAWAKLNGGYDNIVGDKQYLHKLDYGLALTGTYIGYEEINRDTPVEKLYYKLKSHFVDYGLPITLSSLNKKGAQSHEDLVLNHAYALEEFDAENNQVSIYNPHGINHFKNKGLDFILNNFDGIYYFYFRDSDQKFDIPPQKMVKRISPIDSFEEELLHFNEDQFLSKIDQIRFEDRISQLDIEERKNIGKRLAKDSSPLLDFNLLKSSVYKRNYFHGYSIHGKRTEENIINEVEKYIKTHNTFSLDNENCELGCMQYIHLKL